MAPALSRHPGITRSKSGMLRSGEARLTLQGHTAGVTGCAVSPDGAFIVSASWDNTLKVWDAGSGEARLTLHGHTAGVNGCAVSPDGAFIVSASDDKTLKVWDAAQRRSPPHPARAYRWGEWLCGESGWGLHCLGILG